MSRIKIAFLGAGGRMGQSNIAQTLTQSDFEIIGGIEASGSSYLTKDIGLLAQGSALGIYVSDNLTKVLPKADVVVDFTNPKTTLLALEKNVDYKTPFIIGTTGFNAEETTILKRYSLEFPIVLSANFSLGIQVLYKLAHLGAQILSKNRGYDLEILEKHHRFKKDIPSGTALELAEIVENASGRHKNNKKLTYRQPGITEPRSINEIGMMSMRGGDIIGEHTLMLSTIGETLEIRHTANNRASFSKGALTAAKWIQNKAPKLYSMTEVLGLSEDL